MKNVLLSGKDFEHKQAQGVDLLVRKEREEGWGEGKCTILMILMYFL